MPVPPVAPGAQIVEGVTRSGKPCRVVDDTGTIAREELESFLAHLIAEDQFGLKLISAVGSNALKLGEPQFTHVQFGDSLYRLLLFPYEARLQGF
ncbi:MAG: hypothetical protein ACK4IT_09195 [Thioalkalivibrionaceae bacterium]